MDIYDKETNNFEELIEKREIINDILKNISNSEIYDDINEELTKQYNTIKLEQQDIDTYNSLCEDKNRKLQIIEEIDEENNSDEFKEVLGEFIENEKKYREAIYLEEQKREYAERQKKLLREKEIQEERNRRQKLLEEERNKDIERMTKELLEKKKNPILDESKSKDFSVKSNKNNSSKVSSTSFKNTPRIKEDKYKEDYSMPTLNKNTPKLEEESFFNHQELANLNSDINDKKESSWF